MNSSASKISVIQPISAALKHTREVLFNPVDFQKWIAIGFCAFLAGRSGGGQFNSFHQSHNTTQNFDFSNILAYIVHHLAWIIPATAAFLLIFLVLFLVILWLNSRGQFMLLHCVVRNCGEVKVPWKKYQKEAGHLWKFQVMLGLISLANVLLMGGALCWIAFQFVQHRHHLVVSDFSLFLPLGIVFLLVLILFSIIFSLTRQFVVPIMGLRRCTAFEGWKELGQLMRSHVSHFILYLLFQIVLGIATLLILLIAILSTCCLGGVLLMIPFVSSVISLPITIFHRSYQLYYLAQFGEKFDVFAEILRSREVPPPLPTDS